MGNGKYYYIINPLKMMSGDGRHILRSELMSGGEFDGLIQGTEYLGPCWVLVEINRLGAKWAVHNDLFRNSST